MKRLTALTDEQKNLMPAWADQWIERGLRCGKLTDDEWVTWETAARACYEYAKVPWPGVVVRVPNPMVGAFAAPIASHVIEQLRKQKLIPGSAVDSAVYSAVYSAVDSAVDSAVYSAVGSAVGSAVDSAVRSAVRSAVGSAVYSAVRSAVYSAVGSAVGSAVYSAVDSAVDSAVYSAVDSAVRSAVDSAVDSAVYSAVDSAVRSAVYSAVGSAVYSAVDSAVGSAVDSAVYSAVGSAVGSAVDSAVGSAVDSAVGVNWYYYLGGQWWTGWQAYIAYFKEIGLELNDDLWDRAQAYNITTTAGWWWPCADFVMVCDRPNEIQLEPATNDGLRHRLHHDHGAAISWDGWALHFWHGTRIPAAPDEIRTWDTSRILAEPNTETRRALIEVVGWPQFIKAAKLKKVGRSKDDPGNPGQVLSLYDVPEKIYDAPVRVLVCTNATAERDGTRHTFGLTVPATISDPIEAAAWTFNVTTQQYRQLARAC